MTISLPIGLRWQSLPVHPVNRTATIIGASVSQTYTLLNAGELKAVKLGGKTLVTTESIVDYLATAQPWVPDRDRVARAVAARPDVARKAANLNRYVSREPAQRIRFGASASPAPKRKSHAASEAGETPGNRSFERREPGEAPA